jgi:hypothetical protein
MAALLGLVVGAGGGAALISYAQTSAPPPAAGTMWRGDRGPDAWRRMAMRRRRFELGTFALFARSADRQLTTSDVQTIAQALLLWHGNHNWKVIDVAPAGADQIDFDYAAPDNTVIARFSINIHTGRFTRIG